MDMECLTVRVEHGVAPFWRPDVPVDWETAQHSTGNQNGMGGFASDG